MRRFTLLISAAALGCVAILPTQASAFSPPVPPRLSPIAGVRIVCDAFARCFRVDPWGRRIFVRRGGFYPGAGPEGPGPDGEGFDGPRGGGFGPPPERGFGRPAARGYGEDDGPRDRGAMRDGDDRGDGFNRRPRRRDDSGPRPEDGPGGPQGDGQFGRNRAARGDGAQRPQHYGEDDAGGGRSQDEPGGRRGPNGGGGQFGGGGRYQQDDGEQ